MRVMSQSPDPLARMQTMTKRQGKSGTIDVKALLAEDEEFPSGNYLFVMPGIQGRMAPSSGSRPPACGG